MFRWNDNEDVVGSFCLPPHVCLSFLFAPQVAGVEVGDTLQKLEGVVLGSYKEGMAMFKKHKGSFSLTVLRQDEITI